MPRTKHYGNVPGQERCAAESSLEELSLRTKGLRVPTLPATTGSTDYKPDCSPPGGKRAGAEGITHSPRYPQGASPRNSESYIFRLTTSEFLCACMRIFLLLAIKLGICRRRGKHPAMGGDDDQNVAYAESNPITITKRHANDNREGLPRKVRRILSGLVVKNLERHSP